MTSKDLDTGVVNPPKEIVESKSELKEEILRLKGQMAELYQAWVSGRPPPLFPTNCSDILVTILPLSQIKIPTATDIAPQPFHTPPPKTTSYPAPLTTNVFVAPQPTILPRSFRGIVFKVPDAQHYAPEPIFKVSDPYSYAPHFELLGETEKPAKTLGHDEISRKLKDIRLPAGFKMPKFNPHQCYFPPQNPKSHTLYSQYCIHNAPPYAPYPRNQQRLAPPLQMSYSPLQACQLPTRRRFQPRPEYKMRRQQQREMSFTPIGESYASLFQRLRQLDMLKPIQIKILNPLPNNFDFSQRCAYCSNAPGHNIEKCWHLKRAVQKLIDASDITVQNPNAANTSKSSLPIHNETHIVGMICVEKDYENSSESLGGPLTTKLSAQSVSVPKVDLKNKLAKGTQKVFAKVSVMETCGGSGYIDVERSGYDVELGDWKDTPFLASQEGVLVVHFVVISVVRSISGW